MTLLGYSVGLTVQRVPSSARTKQTHPTEIEEKEEDDELPPLPENWPRIPAIFERRSWDFTTAVSPSINKAAAHLELLQV